MLQDRFELRKEDGRYITLDELYDLAKEQIVDELESGMTDDEALYLGNEIRERNNYDILHKNNEREVNEVLGGESPWDILNSDWDNSSDFFVYDYDFEMTDDVWYGLDTDDIAEDILDGSYSQYVTSDISDIVDDYEEAKDWLENLNPIRDKGATLLTQYMNCEADITDLLQFIDKLIRDDDVWEEL